MGKKWRYGVILDAGSSGTRLHIYKWKDPARARKEADEDELESLPRLVTEKKWTKKIRPGISTFGEHPTDVGPEHLHELIDHALDIVPEHKVEDTPVFLMATAGMRLLPSVQQTALLREVCSYLRQNTQFSLPDCDLHIQVIKGETEGLYGWVALNYLLGGFDRPEGHNHGKGHHTYGFLDMGGASAQIAFAPNKTEAAKHANDLKLMRLRTLDGAPKEYQVFTATWLGFGVNQARESYIEGLEKLFEKTKDKEMPDPCMPRGLRTTFNGEVVEKSDPSRPTLIGTGKFKECLKATYPLLGKNAPCPDEPCLLNGQHVPAIDFEVNHFLGVSEYWHTTHGVFGGKDQAYDLTTYQERVTDFCNQDWDDIESTLDKRKKKKPKNGGDAKEAQEACFKASWLLNVLYEGIGVPRLGLDKTPRPGLNASKGALESAKEKGFLDPFQPIDKIEDIEVSWTLGKMVLYAAGQVPPKTGDDRFPVGFGSNTESIPPDFQFAGSSWKPYEHDVDDDWGDSADDFLERARSKKTSGFLVFIFLLVLLAFWLRKPERRTRLLGRFSSLVRRSRRPGSPRKGGRGFSLTNKLFRRSATTYERVLEEGDADQFELGDADSDDNDHSDSSEGSRFGRSSGLATPKVHVDRFDDLRSGSAIDRAGLVVRTESRDRLVPLVPNFQMLNAGRRSRASSPTRLKSPMLPPLRDD